MDDVADAVLLAMIDAASAGGDPAAVLDSLDDGDEDDEDSTREGYTPDEHALLSEAARAGLVLQQVGTHPKTGRPVMRYVRATPKSDPKQAKAAAKATAVESARAIVQKGIKTPKDADALQRLADYADHGEEVPSADDTDPS